MLHGVQKDNLTFALLFRCPLHSKLVLRNPVAVERRTDIRNVGEGHSIIVCLRSEQNLLHMLKRNLRRKLCNENFHEFYNQFIIVTILQFRCSTHKEINVKDAKKFTCKLHESGYLKTYMQNGAILKWISTEML